MLLHSIGRTTRLASATNLKLPFLSQQRTSTVMATTACMKREEHFLNADVQKLLRDLTGRDYKKIFRNRKLGQNLREPTISFMTERDLEHTLQKTEDRADYLLQMPPVLAPVLDEELVMSFDPKIQNHDESAFVFTDISINSASRERLMVVRDLDGTLKSANPKLRRKMNSIYFPSEGRELIVPKMFTRPEVLKAVLDRASPDDNTYEFVLDRACVQFDPDDPDYIAVVETTYDYVDEMRDYDYLKSTRHYGPMVFYLTQKRKLDNLLIYSIQNERIQSDAVPLVSLFTVIFPECKSREKLHLLDDDMDKLRNYIQLDSTRRTELELCLNAYQEMKDSRSDVKEGLERAHGF